MDGKEKKNKMRKPAFLLGVIIIVLAGFGVASIASKIGAAVKDAKKDSIDYTAYGKYLTWVVGIDPDPFTDITKANSDDLLNIALCTLLTDGVKTGEYNVTDDGLIVPAADVEEYFTKMFGNDVTIVHSSVVGYGYSFTYDEANGVYKVPLTGVTPPFTPRIENAEKTGGLVALRVGYVGTSGIEVGVDGSVGAAQPDKYMLITLKETDDGFNLISIANLSEGEYAR